MERSIGFLIEHFAGNFPLWLSPTQVRIIPIAERHNEYAQEIAKELSKERIRVEIDDKSESMQKKIRNAQKEKVYYMIVVGDQEMKQKNINVRTRDGKTSTTTLDAFLKEARDKIQNKTVE